MEVEYLLNEASCKVIVDFERADESDDNKRESENECKDMGGSARSCKGQHPQIPVSPVRRFSGEENSDEIVQLQQFEGRWGYGGGR